MTNRLGGVSAEPYAGFNLATHVGDDPANVDANRKTLAASLSLAAQPHWLTQVHGKHVVTMPGGESTGDGAFTTAPGEVLAIMVADCLPVFLAATDGSAVAILHAGWRGVAGGVIAAGLSRFESRVVAHIGPGIGPCHFEVDAPVRDAMPGFEFAFRDGRDESHWQLDLAAVARRQLLDAGVEEVTGGETCTVCDVTRWFSARGEKTTGRVAGLIWIES